MLLEHQVHEATVANRNQQPMPPATSLDEQMKSKCADQGGIVFGLNCKSCLHTDYKASVFLLDSSQAGTGRVVTFVANIPLSFYKCT
jgi:hypothetical protein